MSKVEYLRGFVNERLTAAAEEIFRGLEKTIVEYEEEIDRQRRLLDIAWKPEIKLHGIELPQHHVCKEEEEVPVDQQLCIQERNSSLDQEDPEPPQIKEEQEEQETDTFMLTPTDEESDHSEDHTLYLNADETLRAAEKESLVNMPVISSVVSVPNSDHQLLSHISQEAESQDQKGGEHGDSGSMRNVEPKSQKRHRKCRSHSNIVNNSNLLEIHSRTGKKSFRCDTCGKQFAYKSNMQKHVRTHSGGKPYVCKTCGERFDYMSSMRIHIRSHTGEKPFVCKTCGKAFRKSSELINHVRIHTGEKPYICETCGKAFRLNKLLALHIRNHTGERPFVCKTCGKGFRQSSELKVHVRTHTGEKPYSCKTCGTRFSQTSSLKTHIRTHTGEKPYSCKTCGQDFMRHSELSVHKMIHTGEKLFICNTCGKAFVCSSNLLVHIRRFHPDERP